MVDYFRDKPGELPGGDREGPPTDLSSWRNIYKVAERVLNDCVIGRRSLGWEVTGMNAFNSIDLIESDLPCPGGLRATWLTCAGIQFGIGVFLWATGSQVDMEIVGLDFADTSKVLPTSTNGSLDTS